MKHKLSILSDNDGTLFDTFELYNDVLYTVIAEEMGDAEIYRREVENIFRELQQQKRLAIGTSWAGIVDLAGEEIGLSSSQRSLILSNFSNRFLKRLASSPNLDYEYTRELLLRSSALEVPVYIHTGTNRLFLEKLLDKHNLTDYISGSICGDDLSYTTTKHDLVARAAAKVPAENYLVFGDTAGDMYAGKALGATTVFFPNINPWVQEERYVDIPSDYRYGDDFYLDGLLELISSFL